MQLKQKYFLQNYGSPEELTVRIVDAMQYLHSKGKKLLLIEMPVSVQKWFSPGRVEKIFDMPVVEGDETCIVYTPIDVIREENHAVE